MLLVDEILVGAGQKVTLAASSDGTTIAVPVVLLGTLSGYLSNSGFSNPWFEALRKPGFMPPGWLCACPAPPWETYPVTSIEPVYWGVGSDLFAFLMNEHRDGAQHVGEHRAVVRLRDDGTKTISANGGPTTSGRRGSSSARRPVATTRCSSSRASG